MPKLNRRRFLQVASAAGLVPAIPTLPVSAATVPSSVTSAQMLWASLFTKVGNAPNVTSLAQSMGISSEAAHGVYAKLARTHILATHGATSLGRVARPVPAALKTSSGAKVLGPRSIKADIDGVFADNLSDEGDLTEVEVTEEEDSVEVSVQLPELIVRET